MLSGKVRRLCLGLFRKKYLESQYSQRRGRCLRCGQCCRLLYVCPHLEALPDGSTGCRIHEKRPSNCRIFPMDPRDLADRDLLGVSPDSRPCGFTFPEKPQA